MSAPPHLAEDKAKKLWRFADETSFSNNKVYLFELREADSPGTALCASLLSFSICTYQKISSVFTPELILCACVCVPGVASTAY